MRSRARIRASQTIKKFLEKRGKFVLRAIDEINIIPDRHAFMNNPAPAISPPAGIGDHKPANQAVLDWVHDIELLTQPENIFWCDGSDRENEFLIGEALKQEVLVVLVAAGIALLGYGVCKIIPRSSPATTLV